MRYLSPPARKEKLWPLWNSVEKGVASQVLAAGLNAECWKACLLIKRRKWKGLTEKGKRGSDGTEMRRARCSSTCQHHHRIAQMRRIFRRCSSEETCQACPDDCCLPWWVAWCSALDESFSSATDIHQPIHFWKHQTQKWLAAIISFASVWFVHSAGTQLSFTLQL